MNYAWGDFQKEFINSTPLQFWNWNWKILNKSQFGAGIPIEWNGIDQLIFVMPLIY